MKHLLILLVLLGASYFCRAQKNPQAIVFKCGLNEVKLDSAASLTCDFFTDSIVKVYFESPQNLHKIQVVYMAEGKEPVSAWFNIDVDSRAAIFSPRSSLSQDFCVPSRLMIYYHSNSMNIQNYMINLNL